MIWVALLAAVPWMLLGIFLVVGVKEPRALPSEDAVEELLAKGPFPTSP